MIRRIDLGLLAEVSAAAKAAPRLRKNHNFHPADDYPGHRLLNAIEPGSYVMPHRHLDPSKDETMVCLAGRLGLVFFNADGSVADRLIAQPGTDLLGVDIPHGVFHSVVALAAGTVFLEAKSGPYLPLNEAEKAPWAPSEGSPEAALYQQKLAALFPAC